jgi:hypothetical protein
MATLTKYLLDNYLLPLSVAMSRPARGPKEQTSARSAQMLAAAVIRSCERAGLPPCRRDEPGSKEPAGRDVA